ncbi:MAG: ribonuclease HI [Alphaproteobacteria bacterium]|nr:ribonuclease HI [Alphaproteobacteria bacterium]
MATISALTPSCRLNGRCGTGEIEFSGSEGHTTNNRMELMAAIQALARLTEPSMVHIHTDSEYVQKGMTIRLRRMKADGWKTSRGKPIKNVELWQALDLQAQRHKVTWIWVRGHNGDPGNERANKLARGAHRCIFSPALTHDRGCIGGAQAAVTRQATHPPICNATNRPGITGWLAGIRGSCRDILIYPTNVHLSLCLHAFDFCTLPKK